jgi:hypothetical protein
MKTLLTRVCSPPSRGSFLTPEIFPMMIDVRKIDYESISDIVYWRWEGRPLNDVKALKELEALGPRYRLCMLKIYAAPRYRRSVKRGRRSGMVLDF